LEQGVQLDLTPISSGHNVRSCDDVDRSLFARFVHEPSCANQPIDRRNRSDKHNRADKHDRVGD
jgi:hypothetical protein